MQNKFVGKEVRISYMIVLFDVQQLYSNLPFIRRKVTSSETICDLMNICTKKVHFTYNYRVYQNK